MTSAHPQPRIGRIDVHSHLLPGVDDGCRTIKESIACARMLVANGYTHSFCTPHIWASHPHLTIETIPGLVTELQSHLDAAGVPLKLMPGGEIGLQPDTITTPPEKLVTFGLRRRVALIDIWVWELPDYFAASIKWMQSLGLTVVLAHPERWKLVQEDPSIVERFQEMRLLLQGNVQPFTDAPDAATRRTAERLLGEDRYFMLGSDLHRVETLPERMEGLKRVEQLAGANRLEQLTRKNPMRLLLSDETRN
jgi:protein-tyrosine phosphatase